ncbi:baculoviral IAP repeat-containing protein 1 isoform X1 [Pantherophis guttatus]|uniref:Baculoviral IAP repeat-containing protein 1 isoform X1 n=1 Tax=Pantherophis guttatus TaxID=94885 RepID=A0A6P9DNG0_PANGU|nr:baculoviral IAP repeat-containing protein 1 isoform X1 [Pantherophis guttatus]
MAAQETSADISNISELDSTYIERFYPQANFNFSKIMEEMELEYRQIRKEHQRGFNPTMRSEAKRLKTFLSLPTGCKSSWAPSEMAAAGFHYISVKTAVQCFCCGLVLLARSLERSPFEEHKKLWSSCEFILGKEVGNISKYDIRVQNPENNSSEVKNKHKEMESRLESFTNWPFYCKEIQPALLANAGFFFTGIKDTVQCFACSGCLGNWEEGDDPWKEHAKWFPECEFLQRKKSRDEIKQYIQSYCGFFGITGKHFTASARKCLPSDPEDLEPFLNIYKDEEIRLESFKTWPHDAHADPAILAKVGFFYTGKNDTVQCFYCSGCLNNWKETDDPWEEHVKFFSHCKLSDPERRISSENSKMQPEAESQHEKQTCYNENPNEIEAISSATTNIALDEREWLQRKLSEAYNDFSFRKTFSFGDHTHFAIDLKLLYGDLAIVSKDISNQPQQQLTLPEVLESFDSITVIEGEAGSGKSALLRKIVILWASGCCPILNRFKFVFYLSLNSGERDQSLADLICSQIIGLKGTLTEDSLKSICQGLTNEVLFLLDEFDKMNGLPCAIEDLIHKNYLNKHCLVIAVRPHQVRGIRQHANTLLSILEFPLSSTLYLLRKLFSYNVRLLGDFFIQLSFEETMRSMLKTPLFVAALASYWAQNPNGDIFTGTVILKAYMLYSLLKYPQEVDLMKAVMSACGELALQGLFKSHFNFSEKDLSEVGVNGEEALYFGLLSKFTAQRLQPLYKFFHLSFQEFLAGQKMSELLASDVEADINKGLEYLQQINSFVKINGRYQYILRYACSEPSKAVPIIISHLMNLLSCKKSLESHSDNDIYLQQTPDLNLKQYKLISIASTLIPEYYHSKFTETVLVLATELAYQSNMVSSCAPMILEFLTGKEVPLYLLKSGSIHKLCLDYPESLFLPSRFEETLTGREELIDMAAAESAFLNLKVPSVEPIYTQGFQLFSNVNQQLKEDLDDINSFRAYRCRQIPDSIIAPFLCVKSREKIPYLKFAVKHMTSLEAPDIQNLTLLFSFFDNIELNLQNCKGLLENIKMAVEGNLKSFKICSLDNTELNELEENLLLSMSSLESLDIKWSASVPVSETLFANLDKYTFLKELSLNLSDCQNIFDTVPEGFKNLRNIEKLILRNVQFKTSSAWLVELIRNFPNLSLFQLQQSTGFDLGALMNAMSSCKKLTEILLNDLNVGDEDLYALTAVLPNFTALKILNLSRLYFENKEACTALALALRSLMNLEEFVLPNGEGIRHAAKLIVQQCFHFPNLRKLEFSLYLSAEGLLEIAKVAADGGFQKLEFLCLSANHKITEETWRNFFQTLSNMPDLQNMDFSRLVTHQIKCQAATVKSFVQCVSRLPNLRSINMIGWLFDEKDLNMFEIMKEQHPQSKDLNLTWKFILPFAPIINE